jgi:hypothetical protein
MEFEVNWGYLIQTFYWVEEYKAKHCNLYELQHVHARSGLRFRGLYYAKYIFEVIDEKLFLLTKLKYGI